MKYLFVVFLLSNVIWSQNLSSHQWKERVIIIRANDSDSELADLQFNMLVTEKEELVDKKLVVYKCISGQCVFYNGRGQKKLFEVDNTDDGFSTVLIGLDGGKKYMSKKVVKPSVFFNLIDQMPMRRQELRDKEKKDD
jgi:hypothetical protein